MSGSLAEHFLGALRPELRDAWAPIEDLDSRLGSALRTAQQAWPEIELASETFVRHLARHAAAPGTDAVVVPERWLGDVYLAAAATAGSTAVASVLQRTVTPDLRAALAHLGLTAPMIDDVLQQLMLHVLVPEGQAPPRIANYGGRGPLGRWLRTIAVRMAMRDARRRAPEEPSLPDALAVPGDFELEFLKQSYGVSFRESLGTALQELQPRERNLLRQHFLDRLTLDAMATLYGVHRATVARWIAKARARLFERTREHLRARLQLPSQELDSIMRMARSRLEVSLRALAEPG